MTTFIEIVRHTLYEFLEILNLQSGPDYDWCQLLDVKLLGKLTTWFY